MSDSRASGRVARGLALACIAGACASEARRPSGHPEARAPTEPAPASASDAPLSSASGAREPRTAVGEDIVIAGRRYAIGTPVVLWTDPGGYSAYGTELFFDGPSPAKAPTGLRYRPGRGLADGERRLQDLPELQALVDQFVLHYDVCGVSRECFRVLHDRRGLSVHFLLDVDGTLYQTLDLCETAWHARQANARSIGVEIANIGAYPPGEASALDTWYAEDASGARLVLPARIGDGGVRVRGFVGRPARPSRICAEVQGGEFEMYDFTAEQYATLAKLAAALCRLFPGIAPDAPRAPGGAVETAVLAPERFEEFRGILGHLHVSADKQDPGPAMDWERFLSAVRSELSRSAP